MAPLPPLLKPEVSLDRVKLVLRNAEAGPYNPWPGIAALSFGLASALLMLWLGMSLVSLLIAVVAALAGWSHMARSAGHRPLVLTLMQNRVRVDDRDLFTGDLVKVVWRCTSPTTRMFLIRADGSEVEALHVLRRTFRSPGVTRKQREWIANQITAHIDPSSKGDIPEELGRLRAEQLSSG